MDVCGSEAIYIPIDECHECDSLRDRIAVLEELLAGKGDVEISMRDIDDEDVTVTVVGTVE